MKKISIVFLVALLMIVMVACSNNDDTNNNVSTEPVDIITDNGLTLKLKEDNTYGVVACDGKIAQVVVPETHNGIQITSIAAGSFDNCDNITNISIPSTINSIESAAFKGCTALVELTIPFVGSDLTASESGYFRYIFGETVPSSLRKVIITSGTQIGVWAFKDCYYIESIVLPDTLTEIGMEAFLNCRGLDSIVIPDSVTKIGFYILKGCTSIESITIPFVGSLDYSKPIAALFGDYNFMQLGTWNVPSSLKSVTLTKIIEISSFMFNDCGNVTSITLPTSLDKIEGGWYILPYNSNVTINYQGTKEQWNAIDKESDWTTSARSCTVICTDGTVKEK